MSEHYDFHLEKMLNEGNEEMSEKELTELRAFYIKLKEQTIKYPELMTELVRLFKKEEM